MEKTILTGFLATCLLFAGCGTSLDIINDNISAEKPEGTYETCSTHKENIQINTILDSESAKYWQIIPKSEFLKPRIEKTIEIKGEFKEWEPNKFTGKGKLVKKWSVPNEKNKRRSWEWATSIPKGWNVFMSGMSSLINPENGDFQEGIFGVGITDGERLFINNSMGPSDLSCYSAYNFSNCWKNLWAGWLYQSNLHIVNGCLIFSGTHENRIFGEGIFRINPINGEIIWGIKPKTANYDSYMLYSHTQSAGGWIWTICTDEDKNYNAKLTKLFRINPQNGSVSHVTLWNVGGIKNINSTDEEPASLVLQTTKNTIIILNADTLQKRTINLDSLHNCKNPSAIEIIGVIGQKMLLKIGESGDDSRNYVLYNFWRENIIYGEDASMIYFSSRNASCYRKKILVLNSGPSTTFTQDYSIQAVDPETLETLWWIDPKEAGPNARILCIDWRGVLIATNHTISCFVEQK
ncbi:MAG TPA: hypothetical protein PL190_02325 [Caldisericia bacterium]|nr:MAG: hypothetical protein BWX90_00774 [bacterium ADurb.Bin132]HNY60828.1 hypothetical protein [Caldisericia bacterium]HOC79069.1 hypothetical protein [Caldisericia bacterium]HOG69869.1 hypothetical protein [Caldisericia bacterium]HPA65354.1 hypothetical protein [Caldisericia bacterium]